MKPLKLADYQVVDDRNAMDHEKAILADAHEAALCMTGGMSYRGTDMALRIQRLITLAMAQQHALISLEEQHATATKRMIEAEQDKKDIQVMYREAERELIEVNGRLRAMFEKVDEVNAEYNSMQE